MEIGETEKPVYIPDRPAVEPERAPRRFEPIETPAPVEDPVKQPVEVPSNV